MCMGETEASIHMSLKSSTSCERINNNIEHLQAKCVLEQMRKIVLCGSLIHLFLCNRQKNGRMHVNTYTHTGSSAIH